MLANDGVRWPYGEMYGIEVVDECATFDSMDRLYSTVDDQFARLLEKGLMGAQYDDEGILMEDVEYALKMAHEGKVRLYD